MTDPGIAASADHVRGASYVCPRDNAELRPGIALQQTYTGYPEFPGAEVVTLSPGGPGELIPCLKCATCGMSFAYARTA